MDEETSPPPPPPPPPPRVLITTTSLADTPGEHHNLLKSSGWDITWARGPLPAEKLIELITALPSTTTTTTTTTTNLPSSRGFDAVICGDDSWNSEVMKLTQPKLQFISKYGIGLGRVSEAVSCKLIGEYEYEYSFCICMNTAIVAP